METIILKGDRIQEIILAETKSEISRLKEKYSRIPGIAFIGFKGVPLAKYSIPLHVNMAEELGFKVLLEIKEENVTEEELFRLIDELNHNNDIHAIVILQPIPPHLNPMRIVNRIDPKKEVEGFHPQHLLNTMLPEVLTGRYPMCLPTALTEIFADAGLTIKKGQEWVFLVDDEFFHNSLTNMIVRTAASKVVPGDCPVTILNKNSEKIIEHCKRADFLVVVSKTPEYQAVIRPDIDVIPIPEHTPPHNQTSTHVCGMFYQREGSCPIIGKQDVAICPDQQLIRISVVCNHLIYRSVISQVVPCDVVPCVSTVSGLYRISFVSIVEVGIGNVWVVGKLIGRSVEYLEF